MFYLGSQHYVKGANAVEEEGFGWWLDRTNTSPSNFNSPKLSRDAKSSDSSSSMLSCLDDPDDADTFALAEDFTPKQTNADEEGTISLIPASPNHIFDPVNNRTDGPSRQTTQLNSYDPLTEEQEPDTPLCYTPERLIRSQEYRILIPPPRFLTGSQNTSTRSHNRQLNLLIDSEKIGASHLEELLDPTAPEIRVPAIYRRKLSFRKHVKKERSCEGALTVANETSPLGYRTPDIASSDSSCERLCTSWEKHTDEILSAAQDDTSGIHSNDSNSESLSDTRTSMRMFDEDHHRPITENTRTSKGTAINEVMAILEGLENDPTRAAVLLGDDRFSDGCSSHDHLARLALAIEQDGNVPGVRGDPDDLVRRLQRKVERLQNANKDIYRDICALRKDFQCEEKRASVLSTEAFRLGREVHEMRYLDDLVNLLQGEIECISQKNWPFNLGHVENQSEELNLIV